MKNNYRDEAEILIWNQGLSIGRIPFPGAAPGHAALELRSEQKPNDRCFISLAARRRYRQPVRTPSHFPPI